MSDKILDCRGLACPQPVIEAKKALETAVKSGDKAAIAKAQANMKNVMDENKAVCPAAKK